MFKIDLSDTYDYKVEMSIPNEKGTPNKSNFTATFNRLKQSELDDLIERSKNGELEDQELIDLVLIDWKGIKDVDGNEIPCNEETRDIVLDVFPVRPSIVTGFFESLSGAKRKN